MFTFTRDLQQSKPMMDHKAFFYGTLVAPPVLYRIIQGPPSSSTTKDISPLRARPAVLHAHKRHRIKNKKYPAILPADMHSSVQGILVEGFTTADIWRLDIYKVPEYARERVSVRLACGETIGAVSLVPHDALDREDEVEADTYVWTDKVEKLEPGEWDFTQFMREEMSWWVGREAIGISFWENQNLQAALIFQIESLGGVNNLDAILMDMGEHTDSVWLGSLDL